jgi:hypothetical protein
MRKRGRKRMTPKQRERKFRPHALVLGQLVLAWSELHEELGRLFYAVAGTNDPGVQLAVWQSSRNDRSQRLMLRGAAAVAFVASPFRSERTKDDKRARHDIEWILNRIEALSDKRDDAIHAPFGLEKQKDGTYRLRPNVLWEIIALASLRSKSRATYRTTSDR